MTLKLLVFTLFPFLLLSSAEQQAKEIKVYDEYSQFEPWLQKDNDTTYVINFWATWCKPCVAELPYFEELSAAYKNEKVKVLLVSLDFAEKLENRIKPFVKQKKLKAQVVVLDDVAQHEWIPKVSEKWTGALPATVIYNGSGYDFYEKSFHYGDLEDALQKRIKNR